MNREEHSSALVKLGSFIAAWLQQNEDLCCRLGGEGAYADFSTTVGCAAKENEWFTEQGIKESLAAISSEMLSEAKLSAWLQSYAYHDYGNSLKPVGVIAAGNIPLVCFHDIICILLSGYGLLLKPSSKDSILVRKVVELLIYFEPKLRGRVGLTDSIRQSDISGLIATGSNNTARYIEYRYADVPVLSRRNRTSVAVLTGNETEEELELLTDDMFLYFGMGCRNVSKLYVPVGYDFSLLLKVLKKWRTSLLKQPKYVNSYKHELAMGLSLGEQLIDGEVFMLKRSDQLNSPLSVVCYDFFANLDIVKKNFTQNADMIQCIASADGLVGNVRFGQTQKPALSDYADGVDTIQWIINNIK